MLNEQDPGRMYRLPTEQEWEYACRAGEYDKPFSCGNFLTTNDANFDAREPYNGGKKGSYKQKTTAVRTGKPNRWGLYQMHGNVSEWCKTAVGFNEYSEGKHDLRKFITGDQFIIRGGSWASPAWQCRSAAKTFRPADWKRVAEQVFVS